MLAIHMNITWQPKLSSEKEGKTQLVLGCHWNLWLEKLFNHIVSHFCGFCSIFVFVFCFYISGFIFLFIQMKVLHWFVWIYCNYFAIKFCVFIKYILILYSYFLLLVITDTRSMRDSCVCLCFLIPHSIPPPTQLKHSIFFIFGIQYNSVAKKIIMKKKVN